jgi:tRNA-splicing ligase RtcB
MQIITTERIPVKLWLDDIEDGALAQAKDLANLKFAFKHIAIMPDSHQGYGMPIGGVMATEQVVVPNAVGVDIGCGMTAIKSDIKVEDISQDDLKEIMGEIRKVIPMGFGHHKEKQEWEGFNSAPDIEVIQKQLENAKYQLGTLGGGNHFIEIQKGDDGFVWVMLHSGSRNFGLQTATEYNKLAQKMCEKWSSDVPNKDLCFLPMDSKEGEDYFKAMNYALDFAFANRHLMLLRIMDIIGNQHFEPAGLINIHHNYAAMENHFGKNVLVHRKGATKATEGLIGIIPGSMGSPSYIVEGLDNAESFKSCSHGAGRRMGRGEAIRTLNLEEEQNKMGDIIGKPRDQKHIDEAPGAYKDIDIVMNNQADLVKIKVKLLPMANIKA